MLKLLTLMTLGLVVELAAPVAGSAQPIPGRDLLEFPLGVVADAPVLTRFSTDGLWNPALVRLDSTSRWGVTVAAMDGPAEQGVSAQMLAFSIPAPWKTTLSTALLLAKVNDIPRTEGDPQSVGSDIPYGTTLLSAAVARTLLEGLTAGVSLRWAEGRLDDLVRSRFYADAGVVYEVRGARDLRLGAATFMLAPGGGSGGESRVSIAAEGTLLELGDDARVRGGYSFARAAALGVDHYLFASSDIRIFSLTAGLLRSSVHGRVTSRVRVGVGLHSGAFSVGLAREENATGISPTYSVVIAAQRER